MRRLLICLFIFPYLMAQGFLWLIEFVLQPVCIFSEWYEQL